GDVGEAGEQRFDHQVERYSSDGGLEPVFPGFTRVRHLSWPKSDKSDFGWGGRRPSSSQRSVPQAIMSLGDGHAWSARRPASVILIRATSIMCAPAKMRSV